MSDSNGEVYRVFTVGSGKVEVGAVIGILHLKGAGTDIPAVMIGEEGRGRERGVVPVGNPPQVPCPDRKKGVWTSVEKCEKCGTALDEKKEGVYTRNHPDAGLVQGRLMFAEVGKTKSGKRKFFSQGKPTTDEKVIVIFNTPIGFRGSNSHTGDRLGWKCDSPTCDVSGGPTSEKPEKCPTCGGTGFMGYGPKLNFAKFPGEVIVTGHIAQGDAGRAGGGQQLIAVMSTEVFRTSYSGRLYGAPSSHYYKWDGSKLISATWDERISADLF